MVESLRPGSCATAIQLHHLAEQYARHLLPTANTNGCSGSPGKIFPFLSTVCDEDTLTRTALHTVEKGGRAVPRSPLKVQTSKAEQKAAKAFQDANPRNLDADITEEAHSATPQRTEDIRGAAAQRSTSSRQTKKDLAADLIEAIRNEVGSPVGSRRSTTERSPVRIPASAPRPDYSLQSQAGSKAVLDASAVHLID